jgi:hypothetical protein
MAVDLREHDGWIVQAWVGPGQMNMDELSCNLEQNTICEENAKPSGHRQITYNKRCFFLFLFFLLVFLKISSMTQIDYTGQCMVD